VLQSPQPDDNEPRDLGAAGAVRRVPAHPGARARQHGQVWLAKDTVLDRLVAVKLISELPAHDAARQRFLTEARARRGSSTQRDRDTGWRAPMIE